MSNARDEILSLLNGKRLHRLPTFGVLPSLTAAGIKSIGARYSDLHTDAQKMARAAASTFRLYGFESAVVPFDLCVEAEALGCAVDFQTDVDAFLAPVVSQPLDFDEYSIQFSSEMKNAGRIPMVAEAIRLLKRDWSEVAIDAWIPGPFTLAWQMFSGAVWLTSLDKTIEIKAELENATDFLALVAQYYHNAGADFITVHEMGGSPQVIGAARFRALVQPALQNLFARLKPPHVLSICGDTNAIVRDLAACGASAINVDHRNDLARTRQILGPDAILLGNYDPIGVLSRGSAEDVARAVEKIARDGASAVVAGCDWHPDVPDENVRALVASSVSRIVR